MGERRGAGGNEGAPLLDGGSDVLEAVESAVER